MRSASSYLSCAADRMVSILCPVFRLTITHCTAVTRTRRARYIRRVETFRRKVAAATEVSKTGKIGVVFLLYHYEHPTELCAAIEARWPLLRFVILTLNLVGEYPDAAMPPAAGDEYASIIDELEDAATAREIACEFNCILPYLRMLI